MRHPFSLARFSQLHLTEVNAPFIVILHTAINALAELRSHFTFLYYLTLLTSIFLQLHFPSITLSLRWEFQQHLQSKIPSNPLYNFLSLWILPNLPVVKHLASWDLFVKWTNIGLLSPSSVVILIRPLLGIFAVNYLSGKDHLLVSVPHLSPMRKEGFLHIATVSKWYHNTNNTNKGNCLFCTQAQGFQAAGEH